MCILQNSTDRVERFNPLGDFDRLFVLATWNRVIDRRIDELCDVLKARTGVDLLSITPC